MSLYILRWNPSISSYKKEHHIDLVSHIKNNQQPDNFDWSIREHEDLKKDDVFILQQVGTDNDGIAMIGKFKDKCYEGNSWRRDGTKLFYADMWIMNAFDCDTENPLSARRYEKLFPEIKWHGGHSGVKVEEALAESLLKQIHTDLVKAEIWQEDQFVKFMSWEFENEFLSQGQRPTAELLADGKILVSLKEQFLKDQNDETYFQVMCCLRDSEVLVPMFTRTDENGEERYYPITVTNNQGEEAIPVFSNDEQADGFLEKDAEGEFYKLPVLEIIEFLKQSEKRLPMILDIQTTPLLIDIDLQDVILQIKYEDESEEEDDDSL